MMKYYSNRSPYILCVILFFMCIHFGCAQTIEKRIQEEERTYVNAKSQLLIFEQNSRTLKRLFVAFGFNNVVGKHKSFGNPYKFVGSRFFEIGGELSTTLSKPGFYRLNYGMSFQFNGLKPKDNQYFVQDGSSTRLEEFPEHLKKSKLRMDNVVIPVHFEFGPTDTDFQARSWRIGLGGFAGMRLGTRQILKYKEDGHRRKEKSAQRLNTNDFIYGLSAYVGNGKTALYAKYDLNPVFKHNSVDEHNLSMGLRITLY